MNTKDLEELLDLCKRVNENNNLAEQLLPTLEGPYFGETDYDEYYFEVIETTITYLEDLLLDIKNLKPFFNFNQLKRLKVVKLDKRLIKSKKITKIP